MEFRLVFGLHGFAKSIQAKKSFRFVE